jgi:hypothetical protein
MTWKLWLRVFGYLALMALIGYVFWTGCKVF